MCVCIQRWVHWLEFGWQFKEFQGRVADDRLDIFRTEAGEGTKRWTLDSICRCLCGLPGNDAPYLSLPGPCGRMCRKEYRREKGWKVCSILAMPQWSGGHCFYFPLSHINCIWPFNYFPKVNNPFPKIKILLTCSLCISWEIKEKVTRILITHRYE